MKKLNCKHGLSRKEEIQARRLKDKILEKDMEVVGTRLINLYKSYKQRIGGSFYDYVKENDIVLYSAFERSVGVKQIYNFMSEL